MTSGKRPLFLVTIFIFLILNLLLWSTLLRKENPSESHVELDDSNTVVLQASRIVYDSKDFSCQNRSGIIRHLFLASQKQESSILDRIFWNYARGLDSLFDTDAVTFWGPGYDGYVDTQSLGSNIVAKFGSLNYFHFIHTSAPYCEAPFCSNLGISSVKNVGTLVAVQFHELRPPNTIAASQQRFSPDIIYSPYPIEFLRSHMRPYVERGLWLWNIPFHLTDQVYYPPTEQKSIDIYFSGSSTIPWYQVRADMLKAMTSVLQHRPSIKYHVRKWAGYGLANSTEQTLDYARELRTARILLTSSTLSLFSVQKYMEAFGSKVFVISDLPSDRPDLFQELLGVIRRRNKGETKEAYIEYLTKEIIYWYDNEEERTRRVELAYKIFKEEYSMQKLADKFRKMITTYKCSGISATPGRYYMPYDYYDRSGRFHRGSEELLRISDVSKYFFTATT